METTMRIDLRIEILDLQSNEWFKRTKGEVLHDGWRKIIWQSMSGFERSAAVDGDDSAPSFRLTGSIK
jgi:hypothetical protein